MIDYEIMIEAVSLVVSIIAIIIPLWLKHREQLKKCAQARTVILAKSLTVHTIADKKTLKGFMRLLGSWHDFYLKTDRNDEALSILKRRHRLLIIGRDGLGKTRLAIEVARELLREKGGALVILWPDPINNTCPPAKGKKPVVLLLDDLDEFIGKVAVSELVRRYEEAYGYDWVYVIATCRLRDLDEVDRQKSLVKLFSEETRYRPPDFSLEEGEKIAKGLGKPFDREAFDGTASSALSEPRLRDAYRALGEESKSLLRAMKLLARVGISLPSKELLERTWREIFGMRSANFEIAYREVEKAGFLSTEILYNIKVVRAPYPWVLNKIVKYKPGLEELRKLFDVVAAGNRPCIRAFNVGIALLRAGDPEAALKCFDYIIEKAKHGLKECEELVDEAYYNKGIALLILNRRLEALSNFAQAFKENAKLAYEYFDVAGTLRKLEESWREAEEPGEKAKVVLRALRYIAALERHLKKYDEKLRAPESERKLWLKRGKSYLGYLDSHERELLRDLLHTLA